MARDTFFSVPAEDYDRIDWGRKTEVEDVNVISKHGKFEVVKLDSARHKHRGIKAFAVRDAKQNYLMYCSDEASASREAERLDKAKEERDGVHH
jgi:hypothetical protein